MILANKTVIFATEFEVGSAGYKSFGTCIVFYVAPGVGDARQASLSWRMF